MAEDTITNNPGMEIFAGPRQDKTYNGEVYRWVPSVRQYRPLNMDFGGERFVLFGDRYVRPDEVKTVVPESAVLNEQTPEQVLHHTMKVVRPMVTGFAAGAGGLALKNPGLARYGASALAGGIVDLLQQYGIEQTGEPDQSAIGSITGLTEPGTWKDRLMGVMENAVALPGAGEVLTKYSIDPIRSGLIRHLKETAQPVPAWLEFRNAPGSFSMMTGGAGSTAEKMAEGRRENLIKQGNQWGYSQGGKMVNEIAGRPASPEFPVLEDLVKSYQGDLKKVSQNIQGLMGDRKRTMTDLGKLNPAIPGGIPVSGAIVPRQSQTLLEGFIKEWEKTIGDKSPIDAFKAVEDDYKPILRIVYDLTAPGPAGSKALPLELMLKAEEKINKLAKWDKEVVDPQTQMFRDLQSKLDSDIRNSMGQWRNGSQEAVRAYDQYTRARDWQKELFQRTTPIRNLVEGNPNASVISEFEKGLRDSDSVRRFAAAGNSLRELRAYKLQQVLQNAWDGSTGKFNATELYNQWNKPEFEGVKRTLYSSAQRSSLDNFITVLQNINTDYNAKSGSWLKFAKGMVWLAAGTGVLGPTLSRHPFIVGSGIAGGLGFTVGIPWYFFARNVLLNPEKARALAFNIKTPPSEASKLLATSFLGGLKGAAVYLQGPNGDTLPGHINSEGQIDPGAPEKNSEEPQEGRIVVKPNQEPTVTDLNFQSGPADYHDWDLPGRSGAQARRNIEKAEELMRRYR